MVGSEGMGVIEWDILAMWIWESCWRVGRSVGEGLEDSGCKTGKMKSVAMVCIPSRIAGDSTA